MTEQGDLLFALHAAQGEFPQVHPCPGTPDDAFYLTAEAFNLADKYQIPVFVMSDQYLADSQFTCERFDTSKITVERHLLSDHELDQAWTTTSVISSLRMAFHPVRFRARKGYLCVRTVTNMMKRDILTRQQITVYA